MKTEFDYISEEERIFKENRFYLRLIENYIGKNKFDRKIAFEITKELIQPIKMEDSIMTKDWWSERMTLEPITINTIKYEPIINQTPQKYKFKDRIKILFTGRKQ